MVNCHFIKNIFLLSLLIRFFHVNGGVFLRTWHPGTLSLYLPKDMQPFLTTAALRLSPLRLNKSECSVGFSWFGSAIMMGIAFDLVEFPSIKLSTAAAWVSDMMCPMMSRQCRQGPISQQITGGSCVNTAWMQSRGILPHAVSRTFGSEHNGGVEGFLRRASRDFDYCNATHIIDKKKYIWKKRRNFKDIK